MSKFSLKKRKVKFSVQLTIQELLSVPFINGVLFCKLRLVEGGSYVSYSSKKEILNSSVLWNYEINFEVKINFNQQLDQFEPCICRISIRKELRGGKSYQKLGYIDYNLSEYINKCETINRVLKEYDSKNRLDNSFLKIKLKLNEISTTSTTVSATAASATTTAAAAAALTNPSTNSINISSLTSAATATIAPLTTNLISEKILTNSPKKQLHQSTTSPLPPPPPPPPQSLTSATITSQQQQQQVPAQYYHQTSSHSRNSSKSSAFSFTDTSKCGHQRNISNGSATSSTSYETTSRNKKKIIDDIQYQEQNIHIIETRVDAHEIINQIEYELAKRKSFNATNNNNNNLINSINQNQQQQQQQQQQTCLAKKLDDSEITSKTNATITNSLAATT